jgi:hypothetical protein
MYDAVFLALDLFLGEVLQKILLFIRVRHGQYSDPVGRHYNNGTPGLQFWLIFFLRQVQGFKRISGKIMYFISCTFHGYGFK